jgi:hypothetical protein
LDHLIFCVFKLFVLKVFFTQANLPTWCDAIVAWLPKAGVGVSRISRCGQVFVDFGCPAP